MLLAKLPSNDLRIRMQGILKPKSKRVWNCSGTALHDNDDQTGSGSMGSTVAANLGVQRLRRAVQLHVR